MTADRDPLHVPRTPLSTARGAGRFGASATLPSALAAAAVIVAATLGGTSSAATTATSSATSTATATAASDGPGAAFLTPAAPSRLAARSLMLDVARAGDRLVSVGERGRVLLSDDNGLHWRQSKNVPVAVTLTAVVFADARNGWATGHAGVVLHTGDAGDSWSLQLDGKRAAALALAAVSDRPAADPLQRTARQWVADGADKPLLALQFTSARSGIVVGAYGLVFSTEDGGATWVSRLADVDNPGGLHLNAVRTVGTSTYLAGEKGLLLRSEAGGRYTALASPYEGSWFGLEALPGGGVVVAGLRGHAYSSGDAGATWQKIEVPGGATLTHATRIAPDRVLFVDQGGSVLTLDSAQRLVPLALPPGAPVTSVAPAADGTVVAATVRGPVRLPLDFLATVQAVASR